MKSTEANIAFPALGFTPDGQLLAFWNLRILTACGPRTLKTGGEIGTEIVDSNGRRWVIRSFRRTGLAQPFFPWLLSTIDHFRPEWRVEQDLEPLEPISFAELKARVCASLETFAGDYVWQLRGRSVESLQAGIRKKRSILEIIERIQPNSFIEY